MPNTKNRFWHVDGTIPVALIVTILLAILGQFAGGIWYFSQMSTKVDAIETAMQRVQGNVSIMTESMNRVSERTARLEAQSALNGAAMIRLDDKFDHILDRGRH